MAGTLLSFSSSEIKIGYREPLLSEALNKKSVGDAAWGIKRGFSLYAPGVGNRTLGVAADATKTDHVAVIETADHSIHLRKTGGNFTIDLTALSGQTVVVALYASYVVGATTTAQIRYYSVAEYDAAPEKPYLVVLGTITVPGTAVPFTDAQVTHDRKTPSWQGVPTQEIPWTQVVTNPNFEWGRENDVSDQSAITGWDNKSGIFKQTAGVGESSSKAVQAVIAASPSSGTLDQSLFLPMVSTTLVRVKAKIRVLIAPTVSILTNIELLWKNAAGTDLTTTLIPLVVVGATDGSLRDIDVVVAPPSGAALLTMVRVRMVSQTWTTTGTVFTLDSLKIFAEKTSVLAEVSAGSSVASTKISLMGPDYPNVTNVDVINFPDSDGQSALFAKRAYFQRIEGAIGDGDAASFVSSYNSGTFDRSMVFRSKDAAGEGDNRVYGSQYGTTDEVINAAYDNSAATWAPDRANISSVRIKRSGEAPVLLDVSTHTNPTTADFSDADWQPVLRVNNPHEAALPVLQVGGVGEYIRNIADRFGLRFNRVTSFHENWLRTAVAPWTANVFGGASSAFVNSTELLARSYALTVTGGGSSVGEIQYASAVASGDLASPILNVMEWEVFFTTSDVTEVTFTMGWGTNGSDGVFAEYNPAANNNWGLKTADGATITHDYSSIPVAAATVYRLRLEMIGNGAGMGGAAINLYVNGVLAVSKTASLPTIGWLSLCSRLEDTDPTATGGTVTMSPITEMSARLLGDDNI